MFEAFMLITLLGIGLSQLLPQAASDQDPDRKRLLAANGRKDDGGREIKPGRAAGNKRAQAHASRARTKSAAGTGRLKKNPCMW